MTDNGACGMLMPTIDGVDGAARDILQAKTGPEGAFPAKNSTTVSLV